MANIDPWYAGRHDLPRRAPKGGIDEFGEHLRGGEFAPFYVPRIVMPQIDDGLYTTLFDLARDEGVEITEVAVSPRDLRPHQRVDVSHAMAMTPEVLALRGLVSADSYILDGNHRWYAHMKAGTDWTVYRLGLPFLDAIGLLFRVPGCKTITPPQG